jgi:hypothetical protein
MLQAAGRSRPLTNRATAVVRSLSSPVMSATTPELQISTNVAGLGRITLSRERQLNALGAGRWAPLTCHMRMAL